MGRFVNYVAFLAAFSLVLGRGCKYIGHQYAPSKRITEDTGAKGDTPKGLLHSQTHFLACHFVSSPGGSLILISKEGWKA